MEILNNFGFEPILLAAQIVNFLIIFFVMKKYLYTPLLKVMEERKEKIAEGLKNADETSRLMQETLQKEKEVLKKAHEDAKKLIAEAKAEQAVIMQQAEEQAHKRVETMLTDAKEQINLQTVQVQKQLSAHVTHVAMQYLSEAVQGMFGPQEQELIMKNAIKKMKKKAD